MRGISTRPPSESFRKSTPNCTVRKRPQRWRASKSKLTNRRREQKVQSGPSAGCRWSSTAASWSTMSPKSVRVTEAPVLPGDSWIPYWDTVQVNLRRYAALDIVGAEVVLNIGKHTATAVTDNHGFADFALPVPNLRVGGTTHTR